MKRTALISGAILGGLAVILGAFGAHYLSAFLEETGRHSTYDTAVKYQFIHALLLIVLGLNGDKVQVKLPVYFALYGTIIFSGSLYLLIFTGITALGAITPIGGLLMILSWAFLAINASKAKF